MDLILDELAKAGISTATKFLFEKVISSAWDKRSNKARKIIEELLDDETYKNFLLKHVSRVIKIRTIHSPESDIYLNEIYHPLSIKRMDGDEKSIFIVKDGFFIENSELTNIIGFAGQGKSTILRKIFIEQIKNGQKIPFFIELRKAEKFGVKKYLEAVLLDCGVNANENDIIELLSSGKIILMLDGFDEINSLNETDILNEITSINIKHSTQIITTTRPNTIICNESSIVNYKVNGLKKSDIIAILKKLNIRGEIDSDLLPSLLKTLNENKGLIGVMNLPILVTLFYVCYPFLDSIPKNTVDFYSRLFTTLYLRHDKIKNFNRKKSSGFEYKDAFDCFNAFCFKSLYDNVLDFNEITLIRYVESAMKIRGKLEDNASPEELANDFINVTCLVQRDGYDRYIFLHKSIQEFHAAEFLKSLNIDKKNNFYSAISNEIIKNAKLANMVRFLMSIDSENATRLILITLCEIHEIDKWKRPSDEQVDFVYEAITREAKLSLSLSNDTVRGDISMGGVMVPYNIFSWIAIFSKRQSSISDFDDLMISFLFSSEVKDELNASSSVLVGMLDDGLASRDEVFSILSDENEMGSDLFVSSVIEALNIKEKLKGLLKNKMMDVHLSLYNENMKKIKKEDDALKGYFEFL